MTVGRMTEREGARLLTGGSPRGDAGSIPAPSVGFDDCARVEAGVAPGGAKQASTGAHASLPASPSGGSGTCRRPAWMDDPEVAREHATEEWERLTAGWEAQAAHWENVRLGFEEETH